MRKMMKRFALCLLFCFMANTAYAGGGALTGVSTEITQIANNVELVAQSLDIAKQLEDMIKNSELLSQIGKLYSTFQDVKNMYDRVAGIIGKMKGLAYNISNIDQVLKDKFKSYADLNFSNATDFTAEAKSISEAVMDTTRNTMEAIGVEMENFEDDVATLQELQEKASTAEGRNQLAQATNGLLGFLSSEALKLRNITMMQAQTINTAMEAERAKEDLAQKEMEEFFKHTTPIPKPTAPHGSPIDNIGD